MAEEVRYVEHPSADLSSMINAIQSMAAQVDNLSGEVVTVNARVDTIQGEFTEFLNQFRQFVEKDLKDRRYAEALSDQNVLQQELEHRFGRHQMIRRYVTGILQAADTSLVRQETMQNCTEELMVAVPHYWLAPALIALSAWLNDNKELAEKALREAMARDDEKTSLLFCLICRRASRNEASGLWLRRYFSMQDPMTIERKLIVVLDAYANGLFGADSKGVCAQQIGSWISEMEDAVGFREEQVARWETAIKGKIPGTDHSDKYPYLKKYAKDWNLINQMLNNAALHGTMHDYLRGVFEQPETGSNELKVQLDELLDSLVSNYDAEELPVRERKRLADLIVECKGDEPEAFRRFDAEKSSFDERSDLTQLLTNAAMNPELVHASPATQKLSMATSKDWMIEAYENVTLQNRNDAIRSIEFEIEGFQGETEDGSEEESLCQKAERFFSEIRDKRISEIKQSTMDFFLLGAGILIFLVSIFTSIPIVVGLIAAAGGVLKFFLGKKKVENDIKTTQEHFAKMIEDAKSIVRAICAEVIDLRKETATLEADYDGLLAYMNEIAPEQYVQNSNQRRIMGA